MRKNIAYIGKTRRPDFLYNTDEETAELARYFRSRMTLCESILWEKLRRKNILGVKFRRQHPIGFYIADFYCHEIALVIEVDGKIHRRKEVMKHDENRSAEMDHYGIKVIRFTNDEIKHHIEKLIKQIRDEIILGKTRVEACDTPGTTSLHSKGRAGEGSK